MRVAQNCSMHCAGMRAGGLRGTRRGVRDIRLPPPALIQNPMRVMHFERDLGNAPAPGMCDGGRLDVDVTWRGIAFTIHLAIRAYSRAAPNFYTALCWIYFITSYAPVISTEKAYHRATITVDVTSKHRGVSGSSVNIFEWGGRRGFPRRGFAKLAAVAGAGEQRFSRSCQRCQR